MTPPHLLQGRMKIDPTLLREFATPGRAVHFHLLRNILARFVRSAVILPEGRIASPKIVAGRAEDSMPKKGGKKKKKR